MHLEGQAAPRSSTEAGFAMASPGDFEAVKAVATAVQGSTICSLARTSKVDIERAGEKVKDAVVAFLAEAT